MGKNLTTAMLLGLAAVFILSTVLSHAWWTIDRRGIEAAVGLTSVQICYKGKCTSRNINTENINENKTYFIVGKSMYYAGFLAVALLLACAIVAFLKVSAAKALGRAVVLLGFIMLVMCIVYLVLKPDSGRGPQPDIGWAPFGFMLANICAIAGGIFSIGLGQSAAFALSADPCGQEPDANPDS